MAAIKKKVLKIETFYCSLPDNNWNGYRHMMCWISEVEFVPEYDQVELLAPSMI